MKVVIEVIKTSPAAFSDANGAKVLAELTGVPQGLSEDQWMELNRLIEALGSLIKKIDS